MRVLVVGGGGREHAVCWALKKSPKVTKLYCAPGNGGISEIAECVPIQATQVSEIVSFAKAHVDFVAVTQDDPLALGMIDELEAAGILAFGPKKNAAILESSKAFSKKLMQDYGIPTADYQVFDDMQAAISHVQTCGAPIVVKADGLALGKGVTVAKTLEEAENAIGELMAEGKFGDSGRRVVIEEFLTGPEVSVLCFTDGKTLVPMPAAQDHKAAFDGDLGPNTGGMGAFCPTPIYTAELADFCMANIFKPTVEAMAKEGRPFSGVLYFGLMLTAAGPKVIEYNARFGDPETQPILSLLETDLFEIFLAVAEGRLADIPIQWKSGAACCVVMASGGYPGSYEKGKEIRGLERVSEEITVFHAGTKKSGSGYVTAGGRVLGVTATACALDEAICKAYEAVQGIAFDGVYYRKDIGCK